MRCFTIALGLAVPAWTLATLTGCGSEVRSYQSSERIEQAEPRMVSPGTEALVPDRVERTEPRMVSPGREVLVPDRVE